ncbi:hypothetical protein EYF80_034783 [Liparis tanakae]|uniref:Uncharacterized protein n=1 Tax=Liparis tanakae TaxID=230148 RepID=A0A4Z2GNB1_9TELE|nr:hypothetical protein EYF80_034783 [Liparis tanakae]
MAAFVSLMTAAGVRGRFHKHLTARALILRLHAALNMAAAGDTNSTNNSKRANGVDLRVNGKTLMERGSSR